MAPKISGLDWTPAAAAPENWEESKDETVSQESDYLDRLKRRIAYLRKRIDRTPRDLSYDKAELAALEWAVTTLQRLMAERNDS